MPVLISLWSVLRKLRFLRSLVWPLSFLLICVTTSWTSCKVSRFLLLRGSREAEANPSSLLPLVSYLFLLPSILFLLLMLSFSIHSQGNPLPAVWKPQDSNNLLLNEVLLNIERGNICGAVYLDLTKPFDTVDHEILMSKLSSGGVSPRFLQWFSSYLSNQKQPKPLVRINYPKLFPLLSGFHKETSKDRYCSWCTSTSYLLLLNSSRYHCTLTIRLFNASQKNLASWRASWM